MSQKGHMHAGQAAVAHPKKELAENLRADGSWPLTASILFHSCCLLISGIDTIVYS